MYIGSNDDVVGDRHAIKWFDDLKGSTDAGCTDPIRSFAVDSFA